MVSYIGGAGLANAALKLRSDACVRHWARQRGNPMMQGERGAAQQSEREGSALEEPRVHWHKHYLVLIVYYQVLIVYCHKDEK